jgi:hypothetical protein
MVGLGSHSLSTRSGVWVKEKRDKLKRNGKIEPAIIRVSVWTTVEFAVIPRVVIGTVNGLRSARQRCGIPTLAGGWNRARKVGKTLRHGHWRW